MSQYIGIDLHKAKSFVTRLDRRGRVLVQLQLAHAGGELQQYLACQYSGLTLNPQSTIECVRTEKSLTTYLEM